MKSLDGKVAVVTGGAGGLGRAMGAAIRPRGHEGDARRRAGRPLGRHRRRAPRRRPRDLGSRHRRHELGLGCRSARRHARDLYGAVHVVCNNAGIGAGAEGKMWEHELNDWRWAIGVNVMGVVHGINAFVPVMIEQGDECHVVNTSSGNGGVSPLPSTPQYAATKAAVVTITECLYGQLQEVGASVGASVLFPGSEHPADRPVRVLAQPHRGVRQGASAPDPVHDGRGPRGTDEGRRRHHRLHPRRGGRRPRPSPTSPTSSGSIRNPIGGDAEMRAPYRVDARPHQSRLSPRALRLTAASLESEPPHDRLR